MDFCSSCLENSVFNHILNRLDFMGASYRRRLPCMERPLQVGSPHCWHALAYDDCISGRAGPIKAHSLVNLTPAAYPSPTIPWLPRQLVFDVDILPPDVGGEKLLFSIYNPFNGGFFQLPSTVRDHERLKHLMGRVETSHGVDFSHPTLVRATLLYGCSNLFR